MPVAVVPPGVYTTLITPFLPDASGMCSCPITTVITPSFESSGC